MRKFVDALAFAALIVVGVAWSETAFGQFAGTATGTGYPAGSTPLFQSGTGTTGQTTVTLAAAPGRVNFLCGLHVEVGSATAAIPVTVTTGGLGPTFTSSANAPVTSATATAGPIISQVFSPCLQSTGANVAVAVSASALGAGGVNQAVNVWGYQVPLN